MGIVYNPVKNPISERRIADLLTISSFLVFTKGGKGRDVVFRGLKRLAGSNVSRT